MSTAKDDELATALVTATRSAITRLFRENPDDHFYYISLVTTGEGHTPNLVAWSKEKLAEMVELNGKPEWYNSLKWSYADSPFFGYGEDEFENVKLLLTSRSPKRDRDSTCNRAEYLRRLDAMEFAMSVIDGEGIFGTDEERNKIVVAAEVMPPDASNVERVVRLNPKEALGEWLKEAAE